MPDRRHLYLPWIAAAVVAVLAACGTDEPSRAPAAPTAIPLPTEQAEPTPGAPGDSEEVTSVACISGGIVRTSFEELEEEATVIVIGTGTGESRPMDELEPGTNFGVAYQVEVERYLKGTGPDMLQVYNKEGCISNTRGPGGKQLRGPWVDALSPIREGARYLFFLRPHPHLPDPDVMTRVAHPSRFLLDGGTASPDGPWPGPTTAWPAMPESDVIETVEGILRPATAQLQTLAVEIAALAPAADRSRDWGQIQRLSTEPFAQMDESAFAPAASSGISTLAAETEPDDWQVDRLGTLATVRLKASPWIRLVFVQSGEDWLLDLGPHARWFGAMYEAGKFPGSVSSQGSGPPGFWESSRDTEPTRYISEDPISLRFEGSQVVYSFELYFSKGLPATMSRDSMRWFANGQEGPQDIVWTNGILTEDTVLFSIGPGVDLQRGDAITYQMSVILDGLPGAARTADVRVGVVLGDGEILQHTRTMEIEEYPDY